MTNKQSARAAGILFLVSTAAYLTGNGMLASMMSAPDYLNQFYPNQLRATAGVLLELINCAAVVGIAVLLFPILRQHDEKIAVGYASFRIMEAVLLTVGALCALLLIPLSREYGLAEVPDASYFAMLGTWAIEGKTLAFQIAMLYLGLGSLPFCYLLLRTRWVPRWLSVLGLAGYAALLTSALLQLLGYPSIMILFLPGALFEIIFPLWLIFKGLPVPSATDK